MCTASKLQIFNRQPIRASTVSGLNGLPLATQISNFSIKILFHGRLPVTSFLCLISFVESTILWNYLSSLNVRYLESRCTKGLNLQNLQESFFSKIILFLIKEKLCDKLFLYCFAAKAEELRRLRKVFPFQKASQLSGLPVICQRIKDFQI